MKNWKIEKQQIFLLTSAFKNVNMSNVPMKCASLAQLAEHLTLNQGVQGSNPWRCTKRNRTVFRLSCFVFCPYLGFEPEKCTWDYIILIVFFRLDTLLCALQPPARKKCINICLFVPINYCACNKLYYLKIRAFCSALCYNQTNNTRALNSYG